jgi:rare lipoprotein A
MSCRALRASALTCIGLLAFTPNAAAQRAPIVYAGEGAEGALAGGNIHGEETGPPGSGQAGEAQAWLERERVGPPYEANGRWYVPTAEPGYAQTGTASWYGTGFHGRPTANGEIFDQDALTAAHPTLPLPSLVQVTNLENGREVIVRVNDRGPFVGGRLIDLSRRAAEVLGFAQAGHARVHVRYLGPAPRRVNGDGAAAPASPPPPLPQPPVIEEGPVSLLSPAAPARAPAPAFIAEGYYVQAGAYADLANAQRARDVAASIGPVVVDAARTGFGVELFRVRIGPYPSRAEAEAARSALAAVGYGESILALR